MSVPEVRVWLFALVGYWWLTPYGRDALGYELLMPDPDWHRIGSRLRLSASGPRAGMSGVRRRGNGIRKPGAVSTQQQRELATLRCWHDAIVRDGVLEDLTDSNPERPPSSTDAARALARLPSVGPYLVKSLLGVLTLTKRIHFDVGVIPPGSYSSVRYLLTGDSALTSRSLTKRIRFERPRQVRRGGLAGRLKSDAGARR